MARTDFAIPADAAEQQPTGLTVSFYQYVDATTDVHITAADEDFDLRPLTLKPGESGSTFVPMSSDKLASGYYRVTTSVEVPNTSSGHGKVTSPKVWTPVIRQDDIGFGHGWNLAGVERIIARPDDPSAGTIYWIRRDGYVLKFDSLNTTAEHDIDANKIGWDGAEFTLADKHGNVSKFDSDGRLIQREDVYGNASTYAYEDMNGDGFALEPVSIVKSIDNSVVSFNYNSLGQVDGIVDTHGNTTLLSYDGSGNLASMTVVDPSDPQGPGISTTFVTDFETGRLSSMTDADGRTTQYKYSPDGNTLTTVHPDDSRTTLVISEVTPYQRKYVGRDRTHSTDFGPRPALVTHNTANLASASAVAKRVGRYFDELGRMTTFEVNDDGYVAKMFDANGTATESVRNSNGQLERETVLNSMGAVIDRTIYEYDGSFNLERVTYFDGTFEEWAYDAASRPLSYTDELGRTTLYDYVDYSLGAAETVTVRQVVGLNDLNSGEFDDLETIYEYDTRGLLVKTLEKRVDPDGTALPSVVTSYAYTDVASCGCGGTSGLYLESITYAVGLTEQATVTVVERDLRGNPTRVRDELERETVYHYDVANRVTAIVLPDPDGAGTQLHPATLFVYTAAGLLDRQIQTSTDNPADVENDHEDAIVTDFQYDTLGRLKYAFENSTSHDGPQAVTEYEYDAVGNMVAEIDPLGRRTDYAFDRLNRPIIVQAPDPDGFAGPKPAPRVTLAYDGLGRLISKGDEHNNVTRYEYDARHRLTKVIAPLGVTAQFVYDAAGQLLRACFEIA